MLRNVQIVAKGKLFTLYAKKLIFDKKKVRFTIKINPMNFYQTIRDYAAQHL